MLTVNQVSSCISKGRWTTETAIPVFTTVITGARLPHERFTGWRNAGDAKITVKFVQVTCRINEIERQLRYWDITYGL
jgi:hypothetical protein